jgi:hypothetical protein
VKGATSLGAGTGHHLAQVRDLFPDLGQAAAISDGLHL